MHQEGPWVQGLKLCQQYYVALEHPQISQLDSVHMNVHNIHITSDVLIAYSKNLTQAVQKSG